MTYKNSITRVAYEYRDKGILKEHVPEQCFMDHTGELQLLPPQRIISTPDGPVYIPYYTPRAAIRVMLNRELKKLRSFEAMAEANSQGTLDL